MSVLKIAMLGAAPMSASSTKKVEQKLLRNLYDIVFFIDGGGRFYSAFSIGSKNKECQVIWVGDGDSLSSKLREKILGVHVGLDSQKNESDFRVALLFMKEILKKYSEQDVEIHGFGLTDGRADHHLSNVFEAEKWLRQMQVLHRKNIAIKFFSFDSKKNQASEYCFFSSGVHVIHSPAFVHFSIFTFHDATEIQIRGSLFELKKWTTLQSPSHGLSNKRLNEKNIQIKVRGGVALLITLK